MKFGLLRRMTRCWGAGAAAALIAGVMPAQADEYEGVRPYIGARTWISVGQTDWNHDASVGSPALGNPTSILTYEEVNTTILELHAKVPIRASFFVRGFVGLGLSQIGDGTLIDEDFISQAAADALGVPTRISLTESVIADTDVFYGTLDVGWAILNFKRFSIYPIAGFQYWREEYEAFGVNQIEDPLGLSGSGQIVSTSVSAITNEVEWISFRLGAITSTRLSDNLGLSIDAAFIPYANMHNEDSHHLRTDLGSVPNFIMDGNGWGFQGETNLGYEITDYLIASIGFRYWTMMSDGDIAIKQSDGTELTFPLNDLDTVRWGATAGILFRF